MTKPQECRNECDGVSGASPRYGKHTAHTDHTQRAGLVTSIAGRGLRASDGWDFGPSTGLDRVGPGNWELRNEYPLELISARVWCGTRFLCPKSAITLSAPTH